METPPFSAELLNLPDDQLGLHLYVGWICYQANVKGISPDAITEAFVEKLRVATLEMNTDDPRQAALEKALQKIAGGDAVASGRLFRNLIHEGAHRMAIERFAELGVQRKRQLSEFARKGNASRRKHTDDDKRRWRKEATAPEIRRVKSKKRKAELIARKLGLPPEAVESIRKAL